MLIDTSALIPFFRKDEQLKDHPTALLTKQKVREVINFKYKIDYTPIILQEVLHGFHGQKEYDVAFALFEDSGEMHQFTDQKQAAIDAADIAVQCRRKGRTIKSPNDCIIALIAIRFNLVLLHHDRDFLNIGKLYPSLNQIHFLDA